MTRARGRRAPLAGEDAGTPAPGEIGVVVPTIDRPEILARCLDRIRAGTLQPSVLVVVDQSRSPADRDAVAAVCAARDAALVHLDVPNASAARNAGAEIAACALVAFIDDDCLARDGWLAALRGAYRSHAAQEPIAAVSGSIGTARWAGGSIAVSSRGGLVERVFRRDVRGAPASWAPWDAGSGGNLLVSMDAFAAAGAFDPRLGPGSRVHAAEDIDLLRRLAFRGAIVFEPSAVVEHLARTRRSRLRSRYAYGVGMGAMCAGARRPLDARRDLLARYVRHVGREAFRHGRWGPVESWLTLAGIATGAWRRLGRARTDPGHGRPQPVLDGPSSSR